MEPRHTWQFYTPDGYSAAMNMIVNGLIIWLGHMNRVTQARLRHANEELSRQAKEKTHFIELVSHELRSPVGAMKTAVHLLEMADENKDARSKAEAIIKRQLLQLSRLVDDLITASGAQKGSLSILRKETDLWHCVLSAVDSNKIDVDRRGQHLLLKGTDGAHRLHVDEGRITQAVANVLHNASKFSPQGSLIRVEAGGDAASAWVTVGDEGPGFWETAPHQTGLGLGLNLCRTLVELHGGRIEIWSNPTGRGAEVRIVLPLSGEASQAVRRHSILPPS